MLRPILKSILKEGGRETRPILKVGRRIPKARLSRVLSEDEINPLRELVDKHIPGLQIKTGIFNVNQEKGFRIAAMDAENNQIYLDSRYMKRLRPKQREAIVLHELGHVKEIGGQGGGRASELIADSFAVREQGTAQHLIGGLRRFEVAASYDAVERAGSGTTLRTARGNFRRASAYHPSMNDRFVSARATAEAITRRDGRGMGLNGLRSTLGV